MINNDIKNIISAVKEFDSVDEIKRIDPLAFYEKNKNKYSDKYLTEIINLEINPTN